MNRTLLAHRLLAPMLIVLLAGCGHAAPDEDEAAAPAGQVAVTTAAPVQQTFHDSIAAWGSAAGDPQRARTISLGHGGQVTALPVAAGQAVKHGQPLLTLSPDPAARSSFEQAQSALTLATGELARTGQLAAQHLATQSQLAAARKALADAQSALAAQRALGGGAASETIEAPVDGVVTALNVGLGDRVAANAPLLGFTPAHALLARLAVQPQDAARLHPGMSVQLSPVYGAQRAMAGTLRMVAQSIDPQTHLVEARVELPAGAAASLVAGTPLQAQIHAADYRAWAVPRGAVLHDEQGDYLFQLEQGKAKRVAMTLRSADGDTVGVDGPLDPQAKVIVLGVYELHDGDAVRESAR